MIARPIDNHALEDDCISVISRAPSPFCPVATPEHSSYIVVIIQHSFTTSHPCGEWARRSHRAALPHECLQSGLASRRHCPRAPDTDTEVQPRYILHLWPCSWAWLCKTLCFSLLLGLGQPSNNISSITTQPTTALLSRCATRAQSELQHGLRRLCGLQVRIHFLDRVCALRGIPGTVESLSLTIALSTLRQQRHF